MPALPSTVVGKQCPCPCPPPSFLIPIFPVFSLCPTEEWGSKQLDGSLAIGQGYTTTPAMLKIPDRILLSTGNSKWNCTCFWVTVKILKKWMQGFPTKPLQKLRPPSTVPSFSWLSLAFRETRKISALAKDEQNRPLLSAHYQAPCWEEVVPG